MLKQESKLVLLTDGLVTASSNSTLTANFDTLGHARAVLDVWYGAAAAVGIPAVLKLSESDDTVVTNFADITQFVAGGTGGFTATNVHTTTTTPNAYRFDVDLKGRKRYLKLTLTPSTAQGATAVNTVMIANLYKAALGLETATKQGVNQLISG